MSAWDKVSAWVTKGSRDFVEAINDLTTAASQAITSVWQGLATNLTAGIMSAIDRTKSLKDAWMDTGRAILKMIGEILVRLALMRALGGAAGWIGGTERGGGGIGVPSWGGGGGGESGPGGGQGGGRAFTSEPVTVNFNIIANDTRGFDSLLLRRRTLIEGIITDAITKRRSLVQTIRAT